MDICVRGKTPMEARGFRLLRHQFLRPAAVPSSPPAGRKGLALRRERGTLTSKVLRGQLTGASTPDQDGRSSPAFDGVVNASRPRNAP